MRWTILLWMFAAVSLLLPVARTFASTVEFLAADLWRQNRDPDHNELAGFVVMAPNGDLELVPWPAPPRALRRAANWEGPLPDRVVGVIHTHPRSLPRPSGQDAAEARRLGLPFYVVSQSSLCVAGASGGVQCSRLRSSRRSLPQLAQQPAPREAVGGPRAD